MRTIRAKIYKFSELSKESQEKAIEKLYDINVDHEWYDFTTSDMIERLNKLGYNDAKVMFSGFSSQGDGACFTCESIDFHKFMGGKYKDFSLEVSAHITHSYRYYFSTSTNVILDQEDNISDEDFTNIEKAIEWEREMLGNEFYRELEKEYEYLTSEKAIIEAIEANEYEFTQEGRMI